MVIKKKEPEIAPRCHKIISRSFDNKYFIDKRLCTGETFSLIPQLLLAHTYVSLLILTLLHLSNAIVIVMDVM